MAPISTPLQSTPSVPSVDAAPSGGAPGALGSYAGSYTGRPAPPAAGYGPGARGRVAAPRATASASGMHAAATLDALLDSLRSERKLLDDLATTMRRQRTAVGADDLQAVDDSVFATHRILATLGQARLRRRQINQLLAGVDEIPMRDLPHVLGAQMTDVLGEARDGLTQSAQSLSQEVEVNRRLLREALAHGDGYARALVGAAPGDAGAASYAADGAAPTAPAGGLLVNRTA